MTRTVLAPGEDGSPAGVPPDVRIRPALVVVSRCETETGCVRPPEPQPHLAVRGHLGTGTNGGSKPRWRSRLHRGSARGFDETGDGHTGSRVRPERPLLLSEDIRFGPLPPTRSSEE
ncbi:hypothetical protein CDG81_15745 [Actinopolyspora erythraea]|uniref:Uncharacterized protein n=1 Tax=Actinopolyspora erythraea TaxID=414996 RepID=A0A099D3X0_9ACTN|nr:hypothetical protein CDG81_15745 [Actinopolyspora erythraea]KGI80883.1 hypothetical protein IL38_14015 [Actinopolyspora erythraea]